MLGSAEKVLVSIKGNEQVYSRTPFILDVMLAALLIAALSAVFYLHRVQLYEKHLNDSSRALLAQAKIIVRGELDNVTAEALLLTTDQSTAGITDKFQTLMRLRPNYRHAALIGLDGQTITKVIRTDTDLMVLGAEQLRAEAIASPVRRGLVGGPGSLYVSAPMSETDMRGERHLMVYLTMPLFGEHFARQGAIIIGYDVDELLTTVGAISATAPGHFELVDDQGRVIDTVTREIVTPGNNVASSSYAWTTDLYVSASDAVHEGQLGLQYSVAATTVIGEKRVKALWAVALWLIALGPTAGLLCLARGARIGERAMKIALARSEKRLLEAEQLARIGHWHWHPQKSLLVLSPQAASMLGCPPGDQHRNLQDFTVLRSLQDEQQFTKRVEEVMTTGEISTTDVRVATLRGDRWLHSIIRPEFDAAGAIIGVFGTLQDITTRKKLEHDLRTVKADYAALLDHLPAGVMYMDLDGRWAMVNEGFLKMTGATRETYEGRHYLDTVLHPDAQQLLAHNFEIMNSGPEKMAELQTTLVNSGSRWFRVDRVPRHDAEGKAAGLVIFLVDITSLKAAEQQLRALTAEREIMLSRIPAGVVYKSIDGHIIRANRMAASFAGMTEEDMQGRTLEECYPLGDHDISRQIDAEVIQTGQPRLGVPISGQISDGSTYWFQIDVFPDFDSNGKVNGIIVFGLDITQRKQAEEQIAYLAMHDPLTDLCNRRLLSDRLTQTLTQCERRQGHCALLFIDLDQFKSVNDLHGHDIGDVLLVQVAERLRAAVRAEDTVSRSGGDEFVILLNETSGAADAAIVAEKIRIALLKPFSLHGVDAQISCSVGVAGFPEHAQNQQDLMHAADTAMYIAKTSGRNRVCVSGSGTCLAHDAA